MIDTKKAKSPDKTQTLIEAKNITLGYSKNGIVIRNLSFKIERGDFVCIVGPNGAGKTTLLSGILGLIPVRSGKIEFIGTEQTGIGYMSQENTIDESFPATVMEIILSGTLANSHNFYPKATKELARKTLKRLGIDHLETNSFSELSGGQRQKVLLARALMATNDLLILDEPSNNLDQKSKRDLYSLLDNLNKKSNIAVLMVTHDLDHDNLIGNKILSLRPNDFFFGSTKEFVKIIHNNSESKSHTSSKKNELAKKVRTHE